jgi:RNA polymerase sigma-70 factor (ECF subfamily)
MGRHAANRPAPDSSPVGPGPVAPASGVPAHADLFTPHPVAPDRERMGDVFDALVAPHRAALRAYVLRLTEGDGAAADSIVKETLYRAAQNPAGYPERASAVRPWLVLTARTVLRDGERLAPAGHDDRPVRADRPARSRDRSGQPATTVVRALDEMAPAHRDVLVELFYRGVSLEEAAEVRGVPVETVKSRLYFAMRALRVVLDQQVADRHDEP